MNDPPRDGSCQLHALAYFMRTSGYSLMQACFAIEIFIIFENAGQTLKANLLTQF